MAVQKRSTCNNTGALSGVEGFTLRDGHLRRRGLGAGEQSAQVDGFLLYALFVKLSSILRLGFPLQDATEGKEGKKKERERDRE